MKTEEIEFEKILADTISVLGSWQEMYRSTIMVAIESVYKKEVTDKWAITDLIVNKDNVLVKWEKRLFPK